MCSPPLFIHLYIHSLSIAAFPTLCRVAWDWSQSQLTISEVGVQTVQVTTSWQRCFHPMKEKHQQTDTNKELGAAFMLCSQKSWISLCPLVSHTMKDLEVPHKSICFPALCLLFCLFFWHPHAVTTFLLQSAIKLCRTATSSTFLQHSFSVVALLSPFTARGRVFSALHRTF